MKIPIISHIVPLTLFVVITVAGCGGGGGGSASPVPTATPRPTATPTLPATPPPIDPDLPPVTPPTTPFDVRGRVLLNGVGQSGVRVTATARDINAATPSDVATSGAGGYYSFFLGAGNYTIRATSGTRSISRDVTVPPGGQTVDNFNLNL